MRWLEQCRAWVREYDPVRKEHFKQDGVHHYSFVRMLSEKLPSNAIIICDTGGNAIMMGHSFQSKTGQLVFSSHANSPMGFALCGAIGAWFADPTRPIICLIGDGGFQLNSQECQTIKHYGVKVKVFILNNKILANTLLYQVQNGKKVLACNLESGYSCPDFVELAKAYGIFAASVVHQDGAAGIIDIVLRTDEAVICDVQQPNFCDFAPRMALWNAGVEELFPPLPAEEFERNMIVPPIDGWRERQAQYKELPDVYK